MVRPVVAELLVALAAVPTLLAAGPPPATRPAADPGPFQFGNVVYRLPGPDWQRGKTTPAYVVMFPHGDAGLGTYVYVTRGDPCGGDLTAWTERHLVAFNDAVNAEQALAGDRLAVVKQEARTTKIGSTPAVMVTQTLRPGGRGGGRATVRVGIGLDAKGRGELVVFQSNSPDGAKTYVKPFVAFAAGVKLVSLGAAPLLGPPTPGPFGGLYFANEVTYGVNGMQANTHLLLLDKGGRFRDGVPTEGPLRGFDYGAGVDREPNETGNYAVAGGALRLDYADGHHDARPYTAAADGGFRFGGEAFSPIAVPADGLTLSGTYTALSYSAFAAGTGMTGGVATSRSYTFAADGRWTLDGFAGASAGYDAGGGFTAGHKDDRSGTYAVKDGTMTLTATDGTVTRRSLVVMAGDRVMIVLGGQTYLDRSKDAGRAKPK